MPDEKSPDSIWAYYETEEKAGRGGIAWILILAYDESLHGNFKSAQDNLKDYELLKGLQPAPKSVNIELSPYG